MNQLVARIGLDASDFQRGMGKVSAGLSSFKGQIAGLFTTAAVTQYVKSVLDLADAIKDGADQANIGIEEYQGLEYVFKSSGTSAKELIKALDQLGAAQSEVLAGTPAAEKMKKAFEFFGVTQSDIVGKNRLELLKQISRQMSETARTGEELANASELFGLKLASAIRPALSEGLDDALSKARQAKQVMSEVVALQLEAQKQSVEETIRGAQVGGAATLADMFNNGKLMIQAAIQSIQGKGPTDMGGVNQFSFLATYAKLLEEADLNAQETFNRLEKANAAKSKDTEKVDEQQRRAKMEETDAKKRAEMEDAVAKRREKERKDEESKFKSVNLGEGIGRDSLVKVGNFLGESGRNIVGELARQQVRLLERIEKNTRQQRSSGLLDFDGVTP